MTRTRIKGLASDNIFEYYTSSDIEDGVIVKTSDPMPGAPAVDITVSFREYKPDLTVRVFGTSKIVELLRGFENYDEPVEVTLDDDYHRIAIFHSRQFKITGSVITSYLTIYTMIDDVNGINRVVAEVVLTIDQARAIVTALVDKLPFHPLNKANKA